MKRESGIKLSEVRSLLSSEEETKVRQRINNSSKKICNREISFFTAAFNISKPRIRRKRFPSPPSVQIGYHLLTYLLTWPESNRITEGRELDSGCKKISSMPRGFFLWDLLKRCEEEETSKRRGKNHVWRNRRNVITSRRHSRRETS